MVVESWTIEKAECRRIDAFEPWCWRKLLKVPWTTRRSNQSILREINPEYWLEGLMLKLKLQYFGHLMWTDDSLEKSLMLGKMEGRRKRGWDGWTASPMQRTWTRANSRRPGVLRSTGRKELDMTGLNEQQQMRTYCGVNLLNCNLTTTIVCKLLWLPRKARIWLIISFNTGTASQGHWMN